MFADPCDARALLRECADMHVICDDGTRIPCIRFQVAQACTILRWVTEDTSERQVPFPGIPSRHLQLALDVVHNVSRLDSYDLESLDCAISGFRVLGCVSIDPSPRLWDLVCSRPIDVLRPRLAMLLRSPGVSRDSILLRAVHLAPTVTDMLATVSACLPDLALGTYLALTLAHMYPISRLVRHVISCVVPRCTLLDAMHIAGSIGIFTHPVEAADIMSFLRNEYDDGTSVSNFVRAMSSALHVYDFAPLTASKFHGSVIMYHDAQSTSVMMTIDGLAPRRAVRACPWLTVHVNADDPSITVTIDHRRIDAAARSAKTMDLRVYVESTNARGEIWYTWCAPEWSAAHDDGPSTATCRRVHGDLDMFNGAVRTGQFARKMTIRMDVFYNVSSALACPPLF